MGYWKYLKNRLECMDYKRLIFNLQILLYVITMFLIGAIPILYLAINIHIAFLILVVPFAILFGFFINYLSFTYYQY